MLIAGASCSVRRVGVVAPGRPSCGGGDRSRGDTGQRGLSFRSGMAEGFCGVGACSGGSLLLGRKFGVVVDDKVRVGVPRSWLLWRSCRVGLMSWWLFLRDLFPVCLVDDVALRGWRDGDPSREAAGDCAAELAADDCFEVWLAVVELFGGGNDGPLGPVVLLVLLLDWAVPKAPSAAAEDLSIMVSESCGFCKLCMSTGAAINGVKSGDWMRWEGTVSLWVARHGRRTSSDATGDTSVGKEGYDARSELRRRLLDIVAGINVHRDRNERRRMQECVLTCKPGADSASWIRKRGQNSESDGDWTFVHRVYRMNSK